jgi:ATP-dependent DNA helicase RecG
MDRPDDYLVSLVHELRKLPRETEWLEFKVNVYEPQRTRRVLSALANSATLSGKAFAYLVWGIADGDHTLVGSTFRPSAAIQRAFRHPVQFQGQEFVRVGSHKKKLKNFPDKERAIWRIFDHTPFEDGVAVERLGDNEVLGLADYPAYFELFSVHFPENRDGILNALASDGLLRRCDAGGWDVTNLGRSSVRQAVGGPAQSPPQGWCE